MSDDVAQFTQRRLRQRLAERLTEIRATGWIVRVQRDLGDALLVDAIDGEGACYSMWIDPLDRYKGVRDLVGRIMATNGPMTLDPNDPATLELIAFADRVAPLA